MIISDVDTGSVLMVISGIKVSWTVELSSLVGGDLFVPYKSI